MRRWKICGTRHSTPQVTGGQHPEEWKSLQSVDKDPFWFFEVIDLRMVAVPVSASWLAYGTLVARTDTPMSIWSRRR